MTPSNTLNLLLLAGLVGFAAFSISFTLHVWQRRHMSSATVATGPVAVLRRWAVRVAILGFLLIAALLAMRELTPRTGVLMGEELFTVRTRADQDLQTLSRQERVDEGEIIAQFEAPADEARRRVLLLEREALEAERRAIQDRPTELASDLVRRRTEADTDGRHLASLLGQLIPARDQIRREASQTRAQREIRLQQLSTELSRLRGELAEIEPQLTLHREKQMRLEELVANDVATMFELNEAINQTQAAKAKVVKLRNQAESVEDERRRVDADLAMTAQLASEQDQKLTQQIDRLHSSLEAATQFERTAAAKLADDTKRAERLRQHELEKVEAKTRQVNAELDGLQSEKTVTAPFSGRVVYRAAAPRTAFNDAPLLVLAPEDGLRMLVRLPLREIEELAETQEVPIALEKPVVRWRFTGRLVKEHVLPDEPGYAIAELSCDLPARTVGELVADNDRRIDARLLWRPPLTSIPMFYLAVVMVGVGVSGWVVSLVWQKDQRQRIRAKEPNDGQEKLQPVAPAASMIPTIPAAFSGAPDTTLRMVAQRLREELSQNEPDADILSAVEWALDRHHGRAVRMLREVLEKEPEACDMLRLHLAESNGFGHEDSDSRSEHGLSVRQRLDRIARAVLREDMVQEPAWDQTSIVSV